MTKMKIEFSGGVDAGAFSGAVSLLRTWGLVNGVKAVVAGSCKCGSGSVQTYDVTAIEESGDGYLLIRIAPINV